MPESKASRPAHRPSRRHQLIEGAVELFAIKPPDLVTIAEIVRHAGMTPAAFYYHFSSRDELFGEVVTRFGEEWASRAEAWWSEANTPGELLEVASRLLDWALENRQHATVFFVTSKGASVAIEDARQSVTGRASAAAAEAFRRATGAKADAEAAVHGLSIVTILESSLRAELALDPTYRTLGPRRFRDEVLNLCVRITEATTEVA
jgi:AcrR family transcriptional regulator